MGQHAAALLWAEGKVGRGEQPPGSNTGPFVQECQAATWLAGTHWPWCVAFWIRAWTQAGRSLPYKGAGAYTMLDWYMKNLPVWVVALRKAKPGAAVILEIGSGHCAMLERPYDGRGTVYTVDGNWGDRVAKTSHPAALVRGVVDPPEHAVPSPVAKPPIFEVVTSASGHSKLVYASGARAVGRKIPALLNHYGGVTIRRRKP